MSASSAAPLFGPAGDSEAFAAAKLPRHAAPEWLARQGLTAYEYQCGHGVRLNPEAARRFRDEAAAHGIAVSLHAPYYISAASQDAEKRQNSIRYILDSAAAVRALGGDRVVVHPGGVGRHTRPEALVLAAETFTRARKALDDHGFEGVFICPETMGKTGQLGDLDEIIALCRLDRRFIPCIDFGHLNARTGGSLRQTEDYAAVLDRLNAELGGERYRRFHAHFSKIEYTRGGERRHLTFADAHFGPPPEPLMALLAQRRLAPTVICESSGTQDADAAAMADMWREVM